MADTEPVNVRDLLIVGKISGLYGIKGWVKIFSETEPRENILDYSPWYLFRDVQHGQDQKVQVMTVAQGRVHGKGLVAQLAGIGDRDQASPYVGQMIAIAKDQLPQIAGDDYYWADLYGLAVETESGQALGTVSHLLETGSNDVLVVVGERERLIPYIRPDVIKTIDLQAGKLVVDWDPEF